MTQQIDSTYFAAFHEYVKGVNTRVEATMQADLDQVLAGGDPLLRDVLTYALFSGGKRIRPLLTVLSATLCGATDTTIYHLASAFEYLHVATLIHDDVIDHAEQRRGRATVCTEFGIPAAILGGDWLHARSMDLVGQLTGQTGLEIFCRATRSMVDGEFLQLRHVADTNTDEDAYFSVIKKKTGNLIASTCEIGAIYAKANQATQQALSSYGEKIGAAFQVVDDLLDFQGETEKTGKKTGNDFIEGKMTLPLIRALQQADAMDRNHLKSLVSGDRTHPETYAQAYALIQNNNGFSSASWTARHLIDQALAALSIFDSDDQQQQVTMLKMLAHYILFRNK